MAGSQTTQVRVVAQDPSVQVDEKILTGLVSFPSEDVEAGPIGHRVHVVDYDASTNTFYKPAPLADPTHRRSDSAMLNDPEFHAQNVYGLVMSTVARFEFALGRRVGWGFAGHQLKVVPHAFAVANAFYSPDSEALLFGYFEHDDRMVYTCLSHDVVVHETTHALVDGLRGRFLKPSSPDQAAFHEGFADIVALLSIFKLPEIVALLIDLAAHSPGGAPPTGLIRKADIQPDRLMESALLGLAEQLMDDGDPGRIGALRRSIKLPPDKRCLERIEFLEPHRRGEVLVAATCRAFLEVWTKRMQALALGDQQFVDRGRAAEEGANVADQLLTMMIRALDYTPPVHLMFGDFLSAVLTADREVRNDDSRYGMRAALRHWCAAYGIAPASDEPDGCWRSSGVQLHHEGVRFSSVQSDPTEMFRLIWANRARLKLPLNAYTWVSDIQPCIRMEPEDGLPVRETIATCIQYLKITAGELAHYGLKKPAALANDDDVVLEGGSTLVLDEYGMLKFQISNGLPRKSDPASCKRAQERLDYLVDTGAMEAGASLRARLSTIHRLRATEVGSAIEEAW